MFAKKTLAMLLTAAVMLGGASAAVHAEKKDSYIKIQVDKENPKKDDIVKASVVINKIEEFSGYQVSVKYDPNALKPINLDDPKAVYDKSTMPKDGDILNKKEFGPFPSASNDLTKGYLNFGKVYIQLDKYQKSGTAEGTGTIAVMGFKALKAAPVKLIFEDTSPKKTMPGELYGTTLFNWRGNQITNGYSVVNYNPAKPQKEEVLLTTFVPEPTPLPTGIKIEPVSPDPNSPQAQQNTSSQNSTPIIILIVCVVIVVGVIAVILKQNKKDNE